jgi:phosphoribosyl-AMP cyclohydrolase
VSAPINDREIAPFERHQNLELLSSYLMYGVFMQWQCLWYPGAKSGKNKLCSELQSKCPEGSTVFAVRMPLP